MMTRLTPGVLALALVLGCGCGCGCGGGEPRGATTEAARASEAAAGAEAEESALVRDAPVGHTVRGRLLDHDLWTYVEVCVKEVVASTPERPELVRYTLRLCTEDGRTEAVALGWSKAEGRKTLFTDSIYETARGETSRLHFECPYGTGWELAATAEEVGGERVRLVVRGEFLACTK